LRAGGELDRLDARRDEVGPSRDRRKLQVGGDERELAQEIEHVRLLPRAVSTEHIRVDHDHAISS